MRCCGSPVNIGNVSTRTVQSAGISSVTSPRVPRIRTMPPVDGHRQARVPVELHGIAAHERVLVVNDERRRVGRFPGALPLLVVGFPASRNVHVGVDLLFVARSGRINIGQDRTTWSTVARPCPPARACCVARSACRVQPVGLNNRRCRGPSQRPLRRTPARNCLCPRGCGRLRPGCPESRV